MTIELIKELLAEQARLMLDFGRHEQELQESIIAREWSRTDSLVATMNQLSSELAALDVRRHEAILAVKRDLGVAEDASFAELLGRCSDADRADLTSLFRSLQLSVLRVKSVTRGIDSYVRGSLRAANEVLGVVFPEQKGTLYSRRGHRAPADGRAMVLDRRL